MTPTPRFGVPDEEAVVRVIRSQQLWRGNGPQWTPGITDSAVDAFEDDVAAELGVPYALAVNSGTSANEAALAALDLPPGAEVICPAASPIFVPHAILAVGAVPVFADVDPTTLLLDPAAVERAVSDRTRAIVAVHLWGLPAPIDDLRDIAGRSGLDLVEDCAQAPATWHRGVRLGTVGSTASFSLQHSKLVSAGEGGLMVARHPEHYARAVIYSNSGMASLRHGLDPAAFGWGERGFHGFGHNHRMSELLGAVAREQFARLPDLIVGRRRLVDAIRSELARRADLSVSAVDEPEDSVVAFWRLPIHVPAGAGDYQGIPVTEPSIARIGRDRVTPFGHPLRDGVDYAPERFPGALQAAATTRVLPLDGDPDEAAALVEARLGDLA